MGSNNTQKKNGGKCWSKAELDYLESAWGRTISIKTIAKKLGRSVTAVIEKSSRLGLGRKTDAGEYITYHRLKQVLNGGAQSSGYAVKSWIENRGLPVRNMTIVNKKIMVIRIADFWRWAESHKSFLDFSKFEPLSLGPEPQWVIKKRMADIRSGKTRRLDKWTEDEDSILRSMTQSGKFTYDEIARRLNRSEGAVARRLRVLGIKLWPQRHDAHEAHWTQEQLCILRDRILQAVPYSLISLEIGKSEKACRGRAYAIWRSENQDKIRKNITIYNGAFERLLHARGRSKEDEAV